MGKTAPESSSTDPHRHHRHSELDPRISRFRLGSFTSFIYITTSLLVLLIGFVVVHRPETFQFVGSNGDLLPSSTSRLVTSVTTTDQTSSATAPTMASIRRTTPMVFPAAGRHTATVIFAHGLGDSGHGWASAVEHWRRRQRLDEVKFILPHAPQIPISVVSLET